jgi:hypothetical protein
MNSHLKKNLPHICKLIPNILLFHNNCLLRNFRFLNFVLKVPKNSNFLLGLLIVLNFKFILKNFASRITKLANSHLDLLQYFKKYYKLHPKSLKHSPLLLWCEESIIEMTLKVDKKKMMGHFRNLISGF